MNAHRIRIAALLAASLFSGCGDSTGPPADITGTYSLITVNGQPLPIFSHENDDHRQDLTAGQLILHPDSTFLLQFRIRVFHKDEGFAEYLDELVIGEFGLDGSHITLRSAVGLDLEGTVRSRTVTLQMTSGNRYEFRRGPQ